MRPRACYDVLMKTGMYRLRREPSHYWVSHECPGGFKNDIDIDPGMPLLVIDEFKFRDIGGGQLCCRVLHGGRLRYIESWVFDDADFERVERAR